MQLGHNMWQHSSSLPNAFIIYAAFCEPAEAHIVEIRLQELEPQDGQACTAVDAIPGFYSSVPNILLPPGIVIPSNCTIKRLISYSCRENFKTCTRTNSPAETKAAKITVQTLILCDACNLVNSLSGAVSQSHRSRSSRERSGRRYSDGIIDQDQLATTFQSGGITFSVKAFETGESKRGRSRGMTGRRGRRSRRDYLVFFCNDRFVSSGSSEQCGMLIK